jgi:Na+/melibiose symporter-like transporter
MAERLSKSLLYTYGVADMFFILMVNMEMFYFTAFLTDYAQFTMALLNFPIKLGILVRSAVVTLGLTAIGFVANAAPAPGVVEGIEFIMIFMPAAASAIAVLIFYYGYKIEDSHVIRMQDEIAARKAGAPEAAQIR